MDKYKKLARNYFIISLIVTLGCVFVMLMFNEEETLLKWIPAGIAIISMLSTVFFGLMYFGYDNVSFPSGYKDQKARKISEMDLLLCAGDVYVVVRENDDFYATPISFIDESIPLSELLMSNVEVIGYSRTKGEIKC